MESSDEDDDFPTHEWITPQSHVRSLYQSHTEKGIRSLCSELLELKDAVENMCGNMQSKYFSFLRISEEVVEMEQELIELQKHASTQRILIQDLMSGVFRELDEWNNSSSESNGGEDLQASDIDKIFANQGEDPKLTFLQTVDVLLAEHKMDEALLAIEKEENLYPELKESEDCPPTDDSSYKVAFLERKSLLVNQLVEVSEQPYAGISVLKKTASSLLKIGRGPLAHQLLLKAYGSCLQTKMEAIFPSCSMYSETYPAILSQLVFSTILMAAKESHTMFGNSSTYSNRIIQWAECEIESFVQKVKENAPQSGGGGGAASALRSVNICLQASLNHCSQLASQGLEFSKLLTVLLHPYIEEVLDSNFELAKRRVLDISGNDEGATLSPQLCLPLSAAATSNLMLTNSGKKFMSIVIDILEQLTPVVILHFGHSILNHLLLLFDEYVETLMRALPGPSEDDNLTEPKEGTDFRVETDAQQLALLGTSFTVAGELLPAAISQILISQNESKGSGHIINSENAISAQELKDWKRHLQHLVDKLKDHFCRQYVLTFIYSREDEARLDAHMYLNGKGKDIYWDSDPLPSLPFQALFARLQQLASVAEDVLGKEKIQKVLLARLIETVVIWLSDEQEFWDVFDDATLQLQPFGLQQLILDMHFIIEIAVLRGYPSRYIHQLVSAIIARAVGAFSRRGIDPQSALPEDEWFVETAKSAINKLLLGTSGSESSEAGGDGDSDPEVLHGDGSDISHDMIPSSPSSIHTVESFASANMGDIDSPVYLTDPES